MKSLLYILFFMLIPGCALDLSPDKSCGLLKQDTNTYEGPEEAGEMMKLAQGTYFKITDRIKDDEGKLLWAKVKLGHGQIAWLQYSWENMTLFSSNNCYGRS